MYKWNNVTGYPDLVEANSRLLWIVHWAQKKNIIYIYKLTLPYRKGTDARYTYSKDYGLVQD